MQVGQVGWGLPLHPWFADTRKEMLPQSDWGTQMPAFLALPRFLEAWPLLKLPLEPHSRFLCHTAHDRAFSQGTQVPGPLHTSAGSGALCGV